MLHIDLRDRRGWLREGLLARITAKLSPYLSCVLFSTTVEDDTPDSDTHNVARSVGFRSFYMILIKDCLRQEMVRTVLSLAVVDGRCIGTWNQLKNRSFKHLPQVT